VFGYLKGMINLGLFYSDFPAVMEGYSDVSWMTSSNDNKSTSGWIFSLGGCAISWAFKKQTCISHSTMESEFIDIATVGKEAKWLRNICLILSCGHNLCQLFLYTAIVKQLCLELIVTFTMVSQNI
jgi:hypothetical protein